MPASARTLFTRWVERADVDAAGSVTIRLAGEMNPTTERLYSRMTVAAAVELLARHRLLVAVRRDSHGKVTCRVRWSFRYSSLTDRQLALNHPPRITASLKTPLHADTNCVATRPLNEVPKETDPKTSSCADTSRRRPPPVIRLQTLSTARTLRYAAARIRAAVCEALPDLCKRLQNQVIDAGAAIVHHRSRAGRLPAGRRFGVYVDEFCDRIAGIPGADLMDVLYSADDEYRAGEVESWTVSEARQALLSWFYWQDFEVRKYVCA
jgi:hypothetical protein